jgi:hypothetical protein
MTTDRPSLLLLCVANSARRQLAEGLEPASDDPSLTRDALLARFRTARQTIRGKLEAFAASELPGRSP